MGCVRILTTTERSDTSLRSSPIAQKTPVFAQLRRGKQKRNPARSLLWILFADLSRRSLGEGGRSDVNTKLEKEIITTE